MANEVMFTTIDTEKYGTTSEEVVSQLREMIHRGDLRHGDRLPPERDLAKQLGVSRPTLRAGIRTLAAVGVLHSKQGAGTFVTDADESPALDSNPLRMMASLHGFTSDEMFEARIAIEMDIAGLAAERASSEQLAAMSEEVAEMFAALDAPEDYLVHDMRFHQIIAAASGNRILTALMNMIASILFETRSKTVHRALDLKESADFHRNIYRCIRDRNPKAAREMMCEHLQHTKKAQEREKLLNNKGVDENAAPAKTSRKEKRPVSVIGK